MFNQGFVPLLITLLAALVPMAGQTASRCPKVLTHSWHQLVDLNDKDTSFKPRTIKNTTIVTTISGQKELQIASSRFPKISDEFYLDKMVELYEEWLFNTDPEVIEEKILGRKTRLHVWFTNLRFKHGERAAPYMRKWWTFFSDRALKIIHQTQKVYIPADVLERLNEKPLPRFRNGYIPGDRHAGLSPQGQKKLREFTKWVEETPLEDLRTKILRSDQWFGHWFSNFRATARKEPNGLTPPWWIYFDKDVLRKMLNAGVFFPAAARDYLSKLDSDSI